MKLAIQLWSVRNEANADFKAAVKQLKKMGYEGVEIAGIDSLSYYEMADILKQEGMTAVSAHIGLDELENEEKLNGLKALGLKYIAFNGLGISPEKLDWTRDYLTRMGKTARDNGIYMLYHNHDYELIGSNGEIPLDTVYNAVAPEYLGAEIDVCWVKYAGIDPAEYVKKYKGRCPIVHLKDYNGKEKENGFSYKAVGSGVVDINGVIEAAKAADTEWLIVEQDNPEEGKTPMQCAEESAMYVLKNI